MTQLRQLIDRSGSKALIEVDGGVNEATGRKLADAGADILVAGSYVFNAPDPLERIDTLKNLESYPSVISESRASRSLM